MLLTVTITFSETKVNVHAVGWCNVPFLYELTHDKGLGKDLIKRFIIGVFSLVKNKEDDENAATENVYIQQGIQTIVNY